MNKTNQINTVSCIHNLGDMTHIYHLPNKGKKQPSQTWVRKNCRRIDSIRNLTLMLCQIEGAADQYYVFYDGFWRAIKQLSDFPSKTPKEILTIYLLYQGGT